MNLINKKHSEILESKSGKNDTYMSVHEDRLYFTNTAAKQFGLIAGQYLQFLNEGSDWSFFQNNDPDGFQLQADTKENSNAVMVCNRALIKMFMKSAKIVKGTRLYLMASNTKYNGIPVIEIVTNKTYDQLMKAV
jgi:hypothetical protein